METKICICMLVCTIILIIILGVIIHILKDMYNVLKKIDHDINYSINKMGLYHMELKDDYLIPLLYKNKDVIDTLRSLEKLLSKTDKQESDTKEE